MYKKFRTEAQSAQRFFQRFVEEQLSTEHSSFTEGNLPCPLWFIFPVPQSFSGFLNGVIIIRRLFKDLLKNNSVLSIHNLPKAALRIDSIHATLSLLSHARIHENKGRHSLDNRNNTGADNGIMAAFCPNFYRFAFDVTGRLWVTN